MQMKVCSHSSNAATEISAGNKNNLSTDEYRWTQIFGMKKIKINPDLSVFICVHLWIKILRFRQTTKGAEQCQRKKQLVFCVREIAV
jgi:hypothetical protein